MSMTISTDTRLNQVKAHMLKYISQHNLKRNDQLPSEAAIAKELGVSRNTLREAYISLENEGIIVRRHGIGTFVAHSIYIQDSLNEFSPFSSIIQAVGYTPKFQTISNQMEQAEQDVADVLKLKLGDDVRCVKRVVSADDTTAIYAEDYIAPAVDEVIQDWEKFDGHMVDFLSQAYEKPLHQIQSNIRAAALDAEIHKYFDLPEGSPILSVRSTLYSIENLPVMFSKLCFNSDIIELNITRMIRMNTSYYQVRKEKN